MKLRMIAAALALAVAIPAIASQNNLYSPTTGTVSGLQLTTNYNNAIESLASCSSGASAPNNLSGGPVAGQCWLDTSVTPNPLKVYDGVSTWVIKGWIDPTNHNWITPLGGGSGSLASATTTDLGSTPANVITITGSTTIGSFGSSALPNTMKLVKFATALTLTSSANLVLPGGTDLVTAAGDYLMAAYLGSGTWAVTNYTRADGSAVKNPAVPVCTMFFSNALTVPANYVRAFGQALARSSYPDYVACATRTLSGSHTSGNATITGLSDTSGFGAGMPVEGSKIGASCTIASVTSSSITLNSGACVTSNGTANLTVFPSGYGSGGDTTKIGVPDCQGRTLAGRDDMSGTAAARLTSTYFGTAATALLAAGGSQSSTLSSSNLPAHAHALSGTFTSTSGGSHHHAYNTFTFTGSGIAVGSGGQQWNNTSVNTDDQGSHTHDITLSGNTGNGPGTSTAFSNVTPTLVAECIIRVLP